MVITSVREIPNLDDDDAGYGAEVKALPYWLYGTDMNGVEYKGIQGDKYHGAVWVGYVQLDPFLGPAKRAVMEATDA
jgi:hypothetical protein